jgi:hypothetical protein
MHGEIGNKPLIKNGSSGSAVGTTRCGVPALNMLGNQHHINIILPQQIVVFHKALRHTQQS